MQKIRLLHLIFAISISISVQGQNSLPKTSVEFISNDSTLKMLYDRAEELAAKNVVQYGDRKVLIEGAKYVSVWLETQPMGGYMYAKRNIQVAKNNIEIFMDYQRNDGRLPGVIYNKELGVQANYCQFQGLCFPMPAYELYYLLNKDTTFLRKVYNCLESFDAYLWKTRDSDGNGCLETWCIYDTGEDENVRFNGFPNGWSFDYPPTKEIAKKLTKEELRINCKQSAYDSTINMVVPMESMDVMSYSYACRHVLSLISKELNNGLEQHWRAEAMVVKDKLKAYLWLPDKNACYDKDKENKTMPILLHNNLRCMYYGSFDQEMADRFIKFHLMNSEEFWTPMPLPSIAANDTNFKNIAGNNWSGQPQGLTFQRSIRALENYGHYAELSMIGKKFLTALSDSLKFTQQFDPFTGQINNSKDGYGPSILAALEFVSRFYGLHITQDKIFWSCLDNEYDYTYSQQWNGKNYSLKTENNQVNCFIDGKQVFSFSKGARIISDLEGNIVEVLGITNTPKQISIKGLNAYNVWVEPNTIYRLDSKNGFTKSESVEYISPY